MAYGSGSLFQRGKKGIWYYQAWVNGKQVGPYSSKSTDRKVAQHELDRLLGKRARGELSHIGGPVDTVNDLIAEYITYAKERLQSARIIEWVLLAHIGPHLGPLRIAHCDVRKLRRYRETRRIEGADDVTCNRELSYLRAAWRRALKDGAVGVIPYFPITKEDNARKGFLEEERFLKLLTELDMALKPFACCLYYVGMRRGETLRLELTDIDLKRGYLEVRRTKNGEPRAVPIFNGPMRQWLQWLWDTRRAGQVKAFVWEDGRPFTERNFYDRWHAACERAGVKGFIPHDSRRSASRNMRNEGIPRSVRKKVIGHKTDSMDERYGIVDFEDAEAVKAKMNKRYDREVHVEPKADTQKPSVRRATKEA